MPTFNRKDHLINTLEALNYQEGYNSTYEVIVVDDGSNDGSYESIKGINKNYDLHYIYLDRYEGSCAGRARNYGWKKATGELIAFIDSDVIVRRDYMKEIERYYRYENNMMLIGTRLMLRNNITPDSIRNGSVFTKYDFNGENFEILENRHYLFDKYSYNAFAIRKSWLKVYGCNIVIPKRWIEKIGGFDEKFLGWGADDVEMGYRAYSQGLNIYIDRKLEVLHQFHGEGDDVIREDKFNGYEMNVNLFYDKHPQAFGLTREQTHEFSKGRLHIDYSIGEGKPVTNKILDFKDPNQLAGLKELLLKLSDKERMEIIVNDYVEDTDLDIWIQLLGKRNSTPKYFPISRKLSTNKLMDKAVFRVAE